MIREGLDRFLASDDRGAMFPHSSVRKFPIYKSDPAAILLEMEVVYRGRGSKKHFHFELLWLSNPAYHEVVRQAWATNGHANMAARIEGDIMVLYRVFSPNYVLKVVVKVLLGAIWY